MVVVEIVVVALVGSVVASLYVVVVVEIVVVARVGSVAESWCCGCVVVVVALSLLCSREHQCHALAGPRSLDPRAISSLHIFVFAQGTFE